MKGSIKLLIIDPQNDFIDLPDEYRPAYPSHLAAQLGERYAPALPVPGAHADMQRLAELLNHGMQGITDIIVTLDSHHRFDIAHPPFWRRADGSMVTPFTEITAEQVRASEFLPQDTRALPRVLAYLDALEATGRYKLMVWPVHCEIGTFGHNVHADVRAAYNAWEMRAAGIVNKVTKGSNPWTEHYSALMAEVPDPDDPGTQLNRTLLYALATADLLLVGGEAGSHCVRATVTDIVRNFDQDRLEKIVLLTDCMSPVSGFEAAHKEFLADMRNRGLQLAQSADVLPALVGNSKR